MTRRCNKEIFFLHNKIFFPEIWLVKSALGWFKQFPSKINSVAWTAGQFAVAFHPDLKIKREIVFSKYQFYFFGGMTRKRTEIMMKEKQTTNSKAQTYFFVFIEFYNWW